MDKKLFQVCKYLISKNFSNASEKELEQSLQALANYFSDHQFRKRITVKYDYSRQDGMCGDCMIDNIRVFPQKHLTDFAVYLECFNTVIHESFHIFQYHLMNMPKEFIAEDATWQRILAYNLYYYAKSSNKYSYYRLNYFELDAYRFTDFFLLNILHQFKKQGIELKELEKYIILERKHYYKDKFYCKKSLTTNNIQKAIDSVNNFFIDDGIYGVAENNEIDISSKQNFRLLKEEVQNTGKFLYSIFNDPICDLSQKFIDNAECMFKKMMPHLFIQKHLDLQTLENTTT